MCMRHDVSTAVQTSARVSSTPPQLVAEHGHGRVRVLHRERPAETTALLRLAELDEIDAADRAQQPLRPVADAQPAQRVAGRVQRTRCGKDAPTSSTPRTSVRNCVSS